MSTTTTKTNGTRGFKSTLHDRAARDYRACPSCLRHKGRVTRGRWTWLMSGHVTKNPKCPLSLLPFESFPVPSRAWWRLVELARRPRLWKQKLKRERELRRLLLRG